jgi:hypothetical protein
MQRRLPPWVGTHDKIKEEEEIREYAAMSPEERLERFCQINRLAWALFSQNPHRDEVLSQRDERSPESLALWKRLMQNRRG